MITVKLGRYSVEMEGHAGQNARGKDIVCASASMLAYTLAQMVLNMEQQGKLKDAPTVDIGSGKACITCKPKRKYKVEAEQVYLVISTGYKLLSHNHPQYVVISQTA